MTFPCARDTVCAAGRCRAWPEDSAWTPVEREVFDREPDLPDWLVSTRRCGALEVQSPSRALRIIGPVYARRVLRFGDSAARAVSVRFRALGSERAELALLSSSGSSMAGVPGCVVARVVAGQLQIRLTNGSSVYEQAADAGAVTVRVELDSARDRIRVWINNAVQRELRLGDFPLLGSYLQVNSAAACDEPAFEIEEVQTWSAP